MESFIQLFLVFEKKNLSDYRTKIIENKHYQWIPYRLYPSSKERQTVKNRKIPNRKIGINPFYLLAQNN